VRTEFLEEKERLIGKESRISGRMDFGNKL
jgi:hypothetical protein